jgi:hypothetical protein
VPSGEAQATPFLPTRVGAIGDGAAAGGGGRVGGWAAGRVAGEGVEEPRAQAGWHAVLTGWVATDMLHPVMMGFMHARCFPGLFLAVASPSTGEATASGTRAIRDCGRKKVRFTMAAHAVRHHVPQVSRAPTAGEERHTALWRHHSGRPALWGLSPH